MIEIEIPEIIVIIEALVASLFFFLSFIAGIKNIVLIRNNRLNRAKYFFVVNFSAFIGLAGGGIFLFVFISDVVFGSPVIDSSSFGSVFIRPLVVLLSSELAIKQKLIGQELKSLSDLRERRARNGHIWTYNSS